MNHPQLFLLILCPTFCIGLQSPAAENGDSADSPVPASAPETDNAEKGVLGGFRDPEDGAFDLSDWLVNKRGFLPVPLIITEPAVGYGGGAALVFFHRKEEDLHVEDRGGKGGTKFNPPSITGIAGFGTENGTWGGALFHRGHYREDTWRYQGALGYANANLRFYGFGDVDLSPVGGLKYNLQGAFTDHQLERRIGNSDFFGGLKYTFANLNNQFDVGQNIPGIEIREFQSRNAGTGVLVGYDTRDNPFTPNRGLRVRLDGTFYNEVFGGDFDYFRLDVDSYKYWSLAEKWVLGWRLGGSFTEGRVPFYGLPFVSLRGVPAQRYQGRQVVLTELELRWNFWKRHSVVGFGGVGAAANHVVDLPQASSVYSGGFGFRTLIARKLGLQSGLDFAWSKEDFAFYIVVGSAWNK